MKVFDLMTTTISGKLYKVETEPGTAWPTGQLTPIDDSAIKGKEPKLQAKIISKEFKTGSVDITYWK